MMSKIELKRVFTKTAAMLACALLPAITFASQDTDAMNARASAMKSSQSEDSRVYVVKGDVFVTPGKNPAHRVIENEIVVSDTLISTGDDSAALLKFEDGQIVTMQANSLFRVREYRYDAKKAENSSILFSMLKGGLRFVTGLIGQRKKQAFRLLTPNATLGIRGTEFMVAMVDNSLYSQVQAGKISMTNAAGVSELGAGQSAVVTSSKALASIVSASAIPAGTFGDLISIPLNPSAIPASVPVPVPAATAPPVPMPEPPAMVATQAVEPPAEVTIEEAAVVESKPDSKSGVGLTGKVGTLGGGAELNLGISENFSARFGINGYTYKYNGNSSSVNYDFNLQLQTVSAIADWYPFSGGFRTSGGLYYNNNKFSLTALPGSVTFGTNTYTIGGSTGTNDISSLKSTMTFNTVAPYLGIGWGNPVAADKGWGLVTDVGVLFQGSPKIDLTATCSSSCGTFASDLATERAKMESDMSGFKWWPVASIGISYQW